MDAPKSAEINTQGSNTTFVPRPDEGAVHLHGRKEKTTKSNSFEKDKHKVDNTASNKPRSCTVKGAATFEDFAKLGAGASDEPVAPTKCVQSPSDRLEGEAPGCMSTITGSSGIYGVPDRVLQISSTSGKHRGSRSTGNETNEARRPRNYHIKSIRRGIPDIMTTDVSGRSYHRATRGMHITTLCLCQGNSKRKRNPTAWLFSVLAAVLCVVCPLFSFVADVTFYVMCSDHYNETANVLTKVKGSERASYIVAEVQPTLLSFVRHGSQRRGHHSSRVSHHSNPPAPLRGRRQSDFDTWNSFPTLPIESQPDDRPSPFNINTNINPVGVQYIVPQQYGKFKRSQNPTPSYVTKYVSNDDTTVFALETTIFPKKAGSAEFACANESAIREFMKTPEATRRLEAHRHVTIDVFEPVFIIGSFPSLLLCIFARLVVMVTAHNHFLSAYVINIAGMPLQLVTGALGVNSAAYHVGQFGFSSTSSCWHCALEGDCSDVSPLSWLNDHVNMSLIVATAAKGLDGAAGGCVLFIVVLRILWREHGNVTLWWYAARVIASLFAFILCVTVSTLLVITPAIGVFRLQFIERVGYFTGREETLSMFMLLLGMGMAAWAASLLAILLYLMYKTYLYCRVKEHAVQIIDED
nr:uncharacterized protein LOC100180528 isoform X1 [Ciona intestinalis]|eukprot:XP_026693939.1 uncharacterized protein LOC100180528 isoform X1 [Ciona intestinalis]